MLISIQYSDVKNSMGRFKGYLYHIDLLSNTFFLYQPEAAFDYNEKTATLGNDFLPSDLSFFDIDESDLVHVKRLKPMCKMLIISTLSGKESVMDTLKNFLPRLDNFRTDSDTILIKTKFYGEIFNSIAYPQIIDFDFLIDLFLKLPVTEESAVMNASAIAALCRLTMYTDLDNETGKMIFERAGKAFDRPLIRDSKSFMKYYGDHLVFRLKFGMTSGNRDYIDSSFKDLASRPFVEFGHNTYCRMIYLLNDLCSDDYVWEIISDLEKSVKDYASSGTLDQSNAKYLRKAELSIGLGKTHYLLNQGESRKAFENLLKMKEEGLLSGLSEKNFFMPDDFGDFIVYFVELGHYFDSREYFLKYLGFLSESYASGVNQGFWAKTISFMLFERLARNVDFFVEIFEKLVNGEFFNGDEYVIFQTTIMVSPLLSLDKYFEDVYPAYFSVIASELTKTYWATFGKTLDKTSPSAEAQRGFLEDSGDEDGDDPEREDEDEDYEDAGEDEDKGDSEDEDKPLDYDSYLTVRAGGVGGARFINPFAPSFFARKNNYFHGEPIDINLPDNMRYINAFFDVKDILSRAPGLKKTGIARFEAKLTLLLASFISLSRFDLTSDSFLFDLLDDVYQCFEDLTDKKIIYERFRHALIFIIQYLLYNDKSHLANEIINACPYVSEDKEFSSHFLGPLFGQTLYLAIPGGKALSGLDSFYKSPPPNKELQDALMYLRYELRLVYEQMMMTPSPSSFNLVTSGYFKTLLAADLILHRFTDKDEMVKEYNELRAHINPDKEEEAYSTIVAFVKYLAAAGDIAKAKEISGHLRQNLPDDLVNFYSMNNSADIAYTACMIIISKALLENKEILQSYQHFFKIPLPITFEKDFKNLAEDLIQVLVSKSMKEEATKVFNGLKSLADDINDRSLILRAGKLLNPPLRPQKGKHQKGKGGKGKRRR
jgi:hypothetical protein